MLTEGYYWDLDDQIRAFGERFLKRTGRMPNMIQAGTYSAVPAVSEGRQGGRHARRPRRSRRSCNELPVDDVFASNGKVLANGRMVHDMYLFEVKKPAESKKPWDYYKLLATIPGDEGVLLGWPRAAARRRSRRAPRRGGRGPPPPVRPPESVILRFSHALRGLPPHDSASRHPEAQGLTKEFRGFVAVKNVESRGAARARSTR